MVRDYPCHLKYNVLYFYIIQYHHSSLLSELSQLIGNTMLISIVHVVVTFHFHCLF